MPLSWSTRSSRMVVRGLKNADAIHSEYKRYTALLEQQISNSSSENVTTGAPVDVRFVTDEDMPRTGWIWCKSQYAAAKIVYETTDQKSRGRIQRLLYDGDYRDYRVDQWIVRPSRHYDPPACRGWSRFRRGVRTMQIYEYWAKQTYKPTAVGDKRRREEFEDLWEM